MKWITILLLPFLWSKVVLAEDDKDTDPWALIQSKLDQLPPKVDAFHTNITKNTHQDINFYVPIDYSEIEQERLFQQFWDEKITMDQRAVYDQLIESSDVYNNPNATFLLSQLHLYGLYNFPTNATLAFQYLTKFNEQTQFSNHTALFELAVMHSTGLFGAIPQDSSKALLHYQKSANLGNLMAQQVLAYKQYMGLNVPRDFNKALLLYSELSHKLRRDLNEPYNELHWQISFPVIESYQIRLSDFDHGLLGDGLNSMGSSLSRKKAMRPDITSSVLTQMNGGGQIILQFGMAGDTAAFSLGDDLDEDEQQGDGLYGGIDDDRLVDLFYKAWDLYRGTYTQLRNVTRTRELLEKTVREYERDVDEMDNLQRFFYSKSLDLLGHIFMMGETLPGGNPDINTAIIYLERAIKVIEESTVVKSRANIDLALISHYAERNATKALGFYKKMIDTRYNDGVIEYQLSQLAAANPNMNLGDPFTLMQTAYSKRYPPAIYEYAQMTEQGVNSKYNVEESTYLYKTFVEKMEPIMAPHLRNAFSELLLGNVDVALWEYTKAAEQGFESAQVSAAFLLYQKTLKFSETPMTTPERKAMAITYYSRAFKQNNVDAGVIAGDAYYDVGAYEKAIGIYESAALKYSPQAIWNLGYMYEYGLGVQKDYHLAKRYYDQVSEVDQKLFIAAKLSLFKLRLKGILDGTRYGKLSQWVPWNYGIPQGIDLSILHWYRKLSIFVQNIIQFRSINKKIWPISLTNNHTRAPHKITVQRMSAGFRIDGPNSDLFEAFGLTTEDLLTIGFILMMLLISVVLRTVAARRGWNIMINGVPVAGGEQGQNEGDVQGDGQQGPAAPEGFFGGNFDVQIFAI